MKGNKLFIVLICLLTLVWLSASVELVLLFACHDFCTAGELFAFLIPNKYEANDISTYILRFELPYLFLLTCCLVGVGVGIWYLTRKLTPPRVFFAVLITGALLAPFIIPNQPCCLLREVIVVSRQILKVKRNKDNAKDFLYPISKSQNIEETKEVYIFSLGESLRYHNLSLNGEYKRDTNPLLKKQRNLYLFSDYYANATLTQYALPIIFTGVKGEEYETHFNRKTLAYPFKEVGFYTALISNEEQLLNNGLHDYLTQDFDTLIWVENDSLIAPKAQELVKQKHKLFIVTHFLGNHFLYRNCPEGYRKWLPDYNLTPRASSDSLFINAYDNTVLYVDALLDKFITDLDEEDMICSLLFISDHGERIMKHFGVHGHTYHPTKEEYHVPLMVWYSDEYKDAYPQKVENVIKHKGKPVCADHVFWSVLDMAGIAINGGLMNEMSIFSDTLAPHERTLLLPDGKSVIKLDK